MIVKSIVLPLECPDFDAIYPSLIDFSSSHQGNVFFSSYDHYYEPILQNGPQTFEACMRQRSLFHSQSVLDQLVHASELMLQPL